MFTVASIMAYSLLSSALPVNSDEEASDSITNVLDEVVITATRTPKFIRDIPVVTHLISSDEIKKSCSENIKDLLTDAIPGIEFSYAMSKETSLSMGGFGGNAVLFLVDGERLAGETMDNVDYSRLNLNNVERVEIVKGAASALYGANAVGGVVNLITKNNSEEWTATVNSRYTQEGNEWLTGGDINFNQDKWNSNTAFNYSNANTIHLKDAFDSKSQIHNVYGGTTINASEKLTFCSSDDLKWIGRGSYFFRTNERETYIDRYTDFSAGLKMLWKGLEVSYGYDQYNKSRWQNGINTHNHDYSNRQQVIHAFYFCNTGPVTVTFGADYLHDFLTSYQFSDRASHSRNSADAFVQADYSPLKWLNILGSIRDDYFSGSNINALTERLALMFKFRPFTVRTSYSGGFRAPTLKELYMEFDMAGISMIYGNPELKPERSHNITISIERNGTVWNGAYSITGSGNYNYYDRRIAIEDIDLNGPNESGTRYFNESGVKVLSADFSVRYLSTMGLGASLCCNYLNMRGHGVDSQFSPPRPLSATWRLDYNHTFSRIYKIYLAISGRYLSSPRSKYETQGAYNILKLTFLQTVRHGIEISFNLDNLLNYRPETYYFNSPPTSGTSLTVGVSLNLNEIYGK